MKFAECVIKVFAEDGFNWIMYVFIIDYDEVDYVITNYNETLSPSFKDKFSFLITHYEMDDENNSIKNERITVLSYELLKRSLLTVCAVESSSKEE